VPLLYTAAASSVTRLWDCASLAAVCTVAATGAKYNRGNVLCP
jgi:hypothetical protein